MNLTQSQRQKIAMQFPELREWLETRETNQILTGLFSQIKMMKGDKGEKGDKGDTPVLGKDYLTDKEVNQIVAYLLKEATPIKGTHYFDGKDYVLTEKDRKEIAQSIEVPTVEKIIERTEVIKEVMPKLDVSHVRGAVSKTELDKRDKMVEAGMARVDGRIKLIDQRWHGGGLSKVSHDSTLSGSGTASDPLIVVSSGSFTGSQEKSTTVPNGVLITFAFTHTPRAIFWNGAFQTLTDDYTVSVNNITFTVSAGIPQTGDKIVNLYA